MIVVIALLAGMVIVSYAGVQSQTRAEDAKANAGSVKKVAEAYFSANNVYPTQVAHFGTTFSKLPSTVTILTSGTLTSNNGQQSILYRHIGSGSGACIMYWDYLPVSGSPGIVTFGLLGSATSGTCNATTGTLPT